jgi:hypothetical protein
MIVFYLFGYLINNYFLFVYFLFHYFAIYQKKHLTLRQDMVD